jgi:hypothetical protein
MKTPWYVPAACLISTVFGAASVEARAPLKDARPAVTWSVTVNTDSVKGEGDSTNHTGELRFCATNAGDGDTIIFDAAVKNQMIILTKGEIKINKSLTIDGMNDGKLMNVTISGNKASRIFNVISRGARVTINNLTFRDGNAGVFSTGGSIKSIGMLTLNKDTFTDNTAGAGGAVSNYGAGNKLTVDGCNFRPNSATGSFLLPAAGGAIYTTTPIVVNHTAFTLNEAKGSAATGSKGGAVAVEGRGNTASFTACVFTNNSATVPKGSKGFGHGGAIYATDALSVSGPLAGFTNNVATDLGGAIYYTPSTTGDSSMELIDLTFADNKAGRGGAVHSSVASTQGTVKATVTGCLFKGNKAIGGSAGDQLGGAFYAQHTVSLTASASLAVANSTFYNNTSESKGGGIALKTTVAGRGANTVVLTSLTMTRNVAAEGGALWIDPTTTTAPEVRNSIIAKNQGDHNPDVFGTVSDARTAGYNLIGQIDPKGSTGWNASNQVGDAAKPIDPGLDANGPADNGGPTKTIKLAVGSVAYQKGDPRINDVNAFDQRGSARAKTATIGAYDPDAVHPKAK